MDTTANIYSGGASEEVLGRFLKANICREAIVIATKVHGVMRDEPNGHGLSRRAIFYELDHSLRRLQTDYVDLYQIHRWDYETSIDETLEALQDVVKSGEGALYRRLVHAHVAIYQSSLSRRPSRLDPFRFHAESLQPALSRRGARDDSPLRV